MKFVIAPEPFPEPFKESVTALEVARPTSIAVHEVFPQADGVVVADGGDGTVDAMVATTAGTLRPVAVTSPRAQPVDAVCGVLGDGRTVIIEMVAASGLVHVAPQDRNPILTRSCGTGEPILAALDQGVRHIILGIGGRATVDGGLGMMTTLGVRFLDVAGQAVAEGGGAGGRVARVDHPLTGPRGAAAILDPRNGATPTMVAERSRNLDPYADIRARDRSIRLTERPGAAAPVRRAARNVAATFERGMHFRSRARVADGVPKSGGPPS
ncbi:MAG: glycerate kinase [Azospirillaceae bacterium]|nr:glycerate kinase [Azospirillaceae bacterium]